MSKLDKRIVIGLAGPDGVGKSTTAIHIARRVSVLHKDWVGYTESFALPLYEALSTMFRVSIDHIRAHKNDIFTESTAPVPCMRGFTWRFMLRQLGSGFGRNLVHPDLWPQIAMSRVKTWAGKTNLITFDDLRFEPESVHCAVIFELMREGVEYAKDHDSSVGLPAHIKRHVINVKTPDETADYIIDFVESGRR